MVLNKSAKQFESKKKSQNMKQVTIMVLTLTLSFTFLTTPSWIWESIRRYNPDLIPPKVLEEGRAVTDTMNTSNFAVNFFIYILTSREMRQTCLLYTSPSPRD